MNRRFEPLQSFLSRNRISRDLFLSPEVAFNRASARVWFRNSITERARLYSVFAFPLAHVRSYWAAINARSKDARCGDAEPPLIRINRGGVARRRAHRFSCIAHGNCCRHVENREVSAVSLLSGRGRSISRLNGHYSEAVQLNYRRNTKGPTRTSDKSESFISQLTPSNRQFLRAWILV